MNQLFVTLTQTSNLEPILIDIGSIVAVAGLNKMRPGNTEITCHGSRYLFDVKETIDEIVLKIREAAIVASNSAATNRGSNDA